MAELTGRGDYIEPSIQSSPEHSDVFPSVPISLQGRCAKTFVERLSLRRAVSGNPNTNSLSTVCLERLRQQPKQSCCNPAPPILRHNKKILNFALETVTRSAMPGDVANYSIIDHSHIPYSRGQGLLRMMLPLKVSSHSRVGGPAQRHCGYIGPGCFTKPNTRDYCHIHRAPTSSGPLRLAADRVESLFRPYQEALAYQCRRCLRHVVQFIHVH